MKVYYSDQFLKHSMGVGHPECPRRLTEIKKELEKCNNIRFLEPKPIAEEELYLVHDKKHIAEIKQLSEKGASYSDNLILSEDDYADNVFRKETFDIALLAASAAKEAALNCNKEFSFALVRPPGHHAGKSSFAGFCYLNNLAFAVRSLQKIKRISKVMIIDIDYHTGNGTWDIFHDDPSVFYLSFHCDPKVAYPGTGFEKENSSHMINVVMKPKTPDKEYLEKFEENVKRYNEEFGPEVIAVSAGFDTYCRDPIAGLGIEKLETYKSIGEIISSLKKPTFATLEGGYYLPELGRIVRSFVEGFHQC